MKKSILKKLSELTSFSAVLMCAFLCGNEAQCMGSSAPQNSNAGLSDEELAVSLEKAFNREGKPVDVILVSRGGSEEARNERMDKSDIAMIFACLAVSFGANRSDIRNELKGMLDASITELKSELKAAEDKSREDFRKLESEVRDEVSRRGIQLSPERYEELEYEEKSCGEADYALNQAKLEEEQIISEIVAKETCQERKRLQAEQLKNAETLGLEEKKMEAILMNFDMHCSQLPSSTVRDSWKIVAFNEKFFSGNSILHQDEVSKIGEQFYRYIKNQEVIAYLNSLITRFLRKDQLNAQNVYSGLVGKRFFNDPQDLNIGWGPNFLFMSSTTPPSLEDYSRNEAWVALYQKKFVEALNDPSRNALECVTNSNIAWYQQYCLSVYDKASYYKEVPLEGSGSSKDGFATFRLPGWVYCTGHRQDACLYDQPYHKLAAAIVNNITSEIGYDNVLGHRLQNRWSNNGQQASKLHILVSDNVATSCLNNFPQDIVTACVDSCGVSAKNNGTNVPVTGVFKGNQMFPHTTYNLTRGKCWYGIAVIHDIFQTHEEPSRRP